MNLSSIITLLQLVLVLLSNPQTAKNAQVQVLATQAISSAAQALSQQQIIVPTVTPSQKSPSVKPLDCPTEVIDVSQIPTGCSTNIITKNLQPLPATSTGIYPTPTLASDFACTQVEVYPDNYKGTQLGTMCLSTSTEMCTYIWPGHFSKPMFCVAIQLCSFEHNCPVN